jgi:hypothetical protein
MMTAIEMEQIIGIFEFFCNPSSSFPHPYLDDYQFAFCQKDYIHFLEFKWMESFNMYSLVFLFVSDVFYLA